MKKQFLILFLLIVTFFIACRPSDSAKLTHAQKLAADRNYKQAIQEYTKLINRRKLLQPALYYRGNAYLELQQYDKALEDYNKLISFHSGNGSVLIYNQNNPLFEPKKDEIPVVKAFSEEVKCFIIRIV